MALFVILGFIIASGFRFLNTLFASNAILQADRTAASDMIYLVNDVKNAREIKSITPTTLQLRSFNFALGFNNPALFSEVNVGTITYQYGLTNGKPSMIRSSIFGGVTKNRALLIGLVQAPSVPAPWFVAVTSSTHAVEVNFKLNVPFWKSQKEIRERLAMEGQGS